MSDTIEVLCQCGRKIVAPKEYAGKTAKCKACGTHFAFPESSAMTTGTVPLVAAIPQVAPAASHQYEPWLYQIIEAIGWLSLFLAGIIAFGLVMAFLESMDAQPEQKPLPSTWFVLCGGTIGSAVNALSCFALVDLLRNVWRIRVKIGS